MKRTLKLTLLAAVLALAVWAGGPQPAAAFYPSCSSLLDCSPNGAQTLCWSDCAGFSLCTCLDGWWQCSSPC